MNPEAPIVPSLQPQSFGQLLSSAVVLNWEALTQSATAGRVRIEYSIGADGAVEYLKLWNAAREYWSLVCEFSSRLSWSDGPRFCNGYHSRPLGRLLQSIVTNPSLTHSFPTRNGMLEVGPPSAEDIEVAKLQVTEAFPPQVAMRGSKRVGELPLMPVKS